MKLRYWLLISVIVGFLAQRLYIIDSSRNPGFYNSYLGFTILFPLLVYGLWQLKNLDKRLVVILSAISFVIMGILNMWLYLVFGGPSSEMYPILGVFVIPVALIVGFLVGIGLVNS